MKKITLSALALAAAAAFTAVSPAQAAVTLIARGTLNATTDLSGLKGTLENGGAENQFGGIGSGLAWVGGTTFLALGDRGPNAVDWNASIDNTTSWIPRFHTVDLTLVPGTGTLPYDVQATLTGTTLLWSPDELTYGPVTPVGPKSARHYFSGRSDNFAAGGDSLTARNARFDPEGLRVSKNTKKVYMTDEYGPYVYEFNRGTGKRSKVFTLPDMFAVSHVAAAGAEEISGNTSGRVANKGMEGLAISPDGNTLIGFMQSPLIQDGGDGGRANRIVTIDRVSGEVKQYAYDNYLADKAKAYNSSEILALNGHEFLVLERDGKGLGDASTAAVKQVWKVSLKGATEVSNLSGAEALLAVAPAKTLFVDLRAALNAAGITDNQIPAKLEGMAFGEDVMVNGVLKHTLYVANDNDFLDTVGGLSNPNQFFVFAFGEEDLGGSKFKNQVFDPK